MNDKHPLCSTLTFAGNGAVELGIQPIHAVPRDLTIEAWINVKAQRQWAGIVSKIFDTGSTESGYGILLDGASGVHAALKAKVGGMHYISSGPGSIALNTWHHVAMTHDGTRLAIHVDGVLKTAVALPASTICHNPLNHLRIGEYGDNDEKYFYTGQVGDVRLWNVCRTVEQLAATRHQRLCGHEEGLVGYWPLDEGDGATVRDATKHALNGTIVNATWTQDRLPVVPLPADEFEANTGLADYSYWWHWKEHLAQSDEDVQFRRGRIWR
jgi:cyanobactin cluster PatC/TenC/TruC protein